ncbi:MAG: helix-turn-helix transcriptional regulator [Candidatus Nanopelagicales bacterium]
MPPWPRWCPLGTRKGLDVAIQHLDPLEVLTDVQLASRLHGLSVETLRKWRKTGKGPPYLKAGGSAVRYRTLDVEAWMLSQKVEPAAEKPAMNQHASAAAQGAGRLLPPHLRGGRGFG